METIESMNTLLKAQGSRLKIELRGKFLSLRGTLPFDDGFKQQRVSLKLQNTEHNLIKAKDTALRISALCDAGLFKPEMLRWEKIPAPDDLSQLSFPVRPQEIWKKFTEFKLSLGVSEATWSKAYLPYLTKIQHCENALSMESACLSVLHGYPENSRARQVCLTALKRFYAFMDQPIPDSFYGVKANYSLKHVKQRELPSSSAIQSEWKSISNKQWQNVFAIMAVFGLRNHEVFNSEIFVSDGCTYCRVKDGTKTGERIALPISRQWLTLFGIKPGMPVPSIKGDNQRIGQQVSLQFCRYGISFKPYDLRHAYAVRAIELFPDVIAAKSLGHSVDALNRIYRKHLASDAFLATAQRYIS